MGTVTRIEPMVGRPGELLKKLYTKLRKTFRVGQPGLLYVIGWSELGTSTDTETEINGHVRWGGRAGIQLDDAATMLEGIVRLIQAEANALRVQAALEKEHAEKDPVLDTLMRETGVEDADAEEEDDDPTVH